MNISQLINREVADSLYFQTNISQLIYNREIIVSLSIQMKISQLINREVADSLYIFTRIFQTNISQLINREVANPHIFRYLFRSLSHTRQNY